MARLMLLVGFAAHISIAARGQTWILTSAPQTNWISVACSANGQTIVAAGSDYQYADGQPGYLYLSTNAGTNWAAANLPSNFWKSVAASADGTRLLAVSGSEWHTNPGYLYISSDSGANWAQSTAPDKVWRSVACSADGNRLAAATYDGSVYTSLNAGLAWASTNMDVYWTDIACSANGSKLVAVSSGAVTGGNGTGQIYLSPDFGQSWNAPANVFITWPQWVSVAISSDANRIVTGGSVAFTGKCCPCANVCLSTNGGTDFYSTSACIWYWISLASSADGSRLIAGAASGGPVSLSTNGAAAWAPSGSFPGPALVACSADGRRLVVAVNEGGIYTADLGGAPVLNMARGGTGAQLIISWTIPAANFVLQQSPTLFPADWSDVSTPPTLDYNTLRNQVTLDAPTGSTFFRLTAR